MKTCFCHLTVVWCPLAAERAIYKSLKSAFSGLQFRRWQYGSIFIRLAVIAREMSPQHSKGIWPYSSSRSSKVIDLGVNGKPICDFLLVINCNFIAVSATVFEIFTLKDRKTADFSHPSLVWRLTRGESLRISGSNLARKVGGRGRWKFHNPIFSSFWDIGSLKAKNRQFCLPWPWNPGQGSLKVIDFSIDGKREYAFLLVINSNFSPILHRSGDMVA